MGSGQDLSGLRKEYSVNLAIKCFPFAEQVVLLAMLPGRVRDSILAPASCSGDSAVSLSPCMRCDVRWADLQVGELYVSWSGSVN